MINRPAYYLILLAVILKIISCGISEDEINQQAKIRFEKRVEELKVEKINECKQEVYRKAEIIVDSIIREMSINPLGETLYKPAIPERPEFVEVDSIVFNSKHSVKPIPK